MLSSNQMQTKKPIAEKYLCPITHQIMSDPVFAADGRTYEREAISTWLETNNASPITNIDLKNKNLIENFDKLSDIAAYLSKHPELYTGEDIYLPRASITDLIMAIKDKQLSIVDRCVTKEQRLLKIKLEHNYTAWHLACQYGSSEITALLLKKLTKEQLSTIIQDNPSGFKPKYVNILLEQALTQSNLQQASVLLSVGAELEQPEFDSNNSLLQRCIIQGNKNAVVWLLDNKANLEHSNKDADTPLHVAATNGNLAIMKLLLEMKGNLNLDAANIDGNTALHLAAKLGKTQLIPALLIAKANHKARNNQWQTPAKLAIKCNHLDTAKLIDQTMRVIKLERLEKLDEIEILHQEISKLKQGISQLENTLAAKTAAKAQPRIEAARAEAAAEVAKAEAARAEAARAEAAKAEAARAEETRKIMANELPKFLKYVVEGEQNQAEAILKQMPELALYPGSVTDLSGRTFNDITGFQYAVWALDSHMWNMIRNYLTLEAAREQVQGLEPGSWVAQHGKSASWRNLSNALAMFIEMCDKDQFDAAKAQWCGVVGNAQQQLPVHVVNQYCHPTRHFGSYQDFKKELLLPRSRETNKGDWFTCEHNGGMLGKNCFAFCRGSGRWAEAGEVSFHGSSVLLLSGRVRSTLLSVIEDREACVRYMDHVTQLREKLFADLASNSYCNKPGL